MAPVVSIVSLTWNSERYIRTMLETLLADAKSSQLEIEILIVDNGSRDRTRSEIEAVRSNHPALRTVPFDTNQGTTGPRHPPLPDASLPAPRVDTFTYDDLRRLESVTYDVFGAADTVTYGNDPNGNLLTRATSNPTWAALPGFAFANIASVRNRLDTTGLGFGYTPSGRLTDDVWPSTGVQSVTPGWRRQPG